MSVNVMLMSMFATTVSLSRCVLNEAVATITKQNSLVGIQ